MKPPLYLNCTDAILLSIEAVSIIRVPSAGTGLKSIVGAVIEPASHF
jgi:hypothetical protein